MNNRRKYRNPPIEEAICEFRFKASQDWDLTFPGKLHSEVMAEYPGKPRQQGVIEAAFHAPSGQAPKLAFRSGITGVQLVSADEKKLLTVGPDVLSVHVLRPYEDWERFRPRIVAALTAYWKLAQPVSVIRIGVRYINKIVVPGEVADLEKYLRCGPPSVKEFPPRMSAFLDRVEYEYEDGVKLVLTLASVEAPPAKSAFLLDLDVIQEGQEALLTSEDKVMTAVDDLRKRERDAFEAAIADPARELFDA